LEPQSQQARGSRRIGLGITGLADALIMLGQHYSSQTARDTAIKIMQCLRDAAYHCSIELAQEKGVFPFFKKEPYLNSPFIRNLPEDFRDDIGKHGIRNSHLIAIAPTGTISLLANNISSGIEPVFHFRHQRKVLNRQGEYETFDLEDYAYRAWCSLGNDPENLPETFVDALSLSPEAHLGMQACLQPFVDNAISKTINVPEDFAFDEFQGLYRQAFDLGLKGCTTFRPNPTRGEILSFDKGSHCCSIEREGE
jgi:ribonucleoside-diphosphate reductase alpha chain